MLVKASEKISIPGIKYNEDIANILTNAAWVLDGATGLGNEQLMPGDSDAKWYVEMWDKYLTDTMANKEKSLREIMLEGIEHIEKEYMDIIANREVKDINKPSSGIALLRWNEDELEYFILGDCQLWINSNKGTTVIADYKLSKLDNEAVSEMRNYIDKGYSLEDARRSIQEILVNNRLKSNKKDGYWVLGFSKEAISNALSNRIAMDEQLTFLSVLLSTDGFYSIIDKYKAMSEKEVFDNINRLGLQYIFSYIRKIEEEDSQALKYVRFKKSDDASAVYLSFQKN